MQNLIELVQLLHFYCNKKSIMQMLAYNASSILPLVSIGVVKVVQGNCASGNFFYVSSI